MSDLVLVLPFLNNSPDFALGWEAGKVWEQMKAKQEQIEGMYHSSNDEQLLLMASRCGYDSTFRHTEVDGWTEMSFTLKDEWKRAKGGELEHA